MILVQVNGLFGHFAVSDEGRFTKDQDYNKEVSEVLSASDHLQFIRRWNILQFKLQEARKYLSLNKYNNSYRFVSSLHYDVTALHKLIHLAGTHLQTTFYCNKVSASFQI
jgi:hypothetical protein